MTPVPALDLAQALACLVDEPTVLALAGTPAEDSATYLAWGAAVTPLASTPGMALGPWLDALVPRAPAAPGSTLPARMGWTGWDGRGVLVQLDYEAPACAGRAWRVEAFARWQGGRGPTLHGPPALVAAMAAQLGRRAPPLPLPRLAGELAPSLPRAAHAARVRELQARIGAGEIYQANLTLGFAGQLVPGPARDVAVFCALHATSPAAYAAFLRAPGQPSVVSHAPECFLRARGPRVVSAPIKGTRPRVPGQEAQARATLSASAKDRAELVMIVDLVRNDLGRVAVPGSVRVLQPPTLLDLDYAHHLVAEVGCELRDGAGYGALVAAAFPAGSITGAPKLHAMALLRRLEPAARGAYCGTFGWIAPDGCELAVAIRTVLVDGARVRVCAGGGIVADSDPDAEWEELCAKSAAMRQALGATHGAAGG